LVSNADDELRDNFSGVDYRERSQVTVAVGTGEAPDIEFDTSGSETTPITDDNGNLYQTYDRLMYIGGTGVDLGGLVVSGTIELSRYLGEAFGNVASFLTQSPISLNIVAPDGEELKRISADFESDQPTEYDDVWVRFDAPTGEYDIEVVGEGEGEYTVESHVETISGGQIDDSFSASIQEGESQTLTAMVPEQEGSEGSIDLSTESGQDGTEGSVDDTTDGADDQDRTGGDDTPIDDGNTDTDDSTPGFGVGATVAGLSAAGYLLKSRLRAKDSED
jgi:PGF-CTERM protein